MGDIVREDMFIDEVEAKIAYAILRLQNESAATQKNISDFIGGTIATVCRKLPRLLSAEVISRIRARQQNARYTYKIEGEKEIDNQDSALIALELYEFPKDPKQNTLNKQEFIRHIINSQKLTMLDQAPDNISQKLEEMDNKGKYIEILDNFIKVLPRIRHHINYICLVAHQPEKDQLDSFPFPRVSPWDAARKALAKVRHRKKK